MTWVISDFDKGRLLPVAAAGRLSVTPHNGGSTEIKSSLPLKKYNLLFSLKDRDYCPHLDVLGCIRELPKVTQEDCHRIKNNVMQFFSCFFWGKI